MSNFSTENQIIRKKCTRNKKIQKKKNSHSEITWVGSVLKNQKALKPKKKKKQKRKSVNFEIFAKLLKNYDPVESNWVVCRSSND